MNENLLIPDARTPLQQAPSLSPSHPDSTQGGGRARFLVVLDVDSTLIENEVIELLAACAGRLAEVAEVTERAMSGELDFEASLRARVATLAGLSTSCFADVAADIRVTDGVTGLISALHAAGGLVGVVSGGFHELVDGVAESLGLDFWSANRLEAVDGVLTGQVIGPVIDAQAKADSLETWARASGIPLSQTVAVGDGANDLLMMDVAGLSVAFCARPVVRASANLAIDTRDLSQLLPLLGLRG